MPLLASLLDKFEDDHAFEQMCVELLQREGYTQIEPLGGSDDKGRDAEQRVFAGASGQRTLFFQFTLQSAFRTKVRQTLKRLNEAKKTANTVFFVFSKHISPKLKDQLTEFAQSEFEQDIEIKDQRFLVSRLSQKPYRDITQRYFAQDLAQLRALWDEDLLFADTSAMQDQAKRVLANVVNYAQHPFAGDFRIELIRQTVRTALCETSEPLSPQDVLTSVRQVLPTTLTMPDADLNEAITDLIHEGDIAEEEGLLSLTPVAKTQIALEIGEVVIGRRKLYDLVIKYFAPLGARAPSMIAIRETLMSFFSELFRNYGAEIANAILDRDSDEMKTALSGEETARVMASTIPDNWAPVAGEAFRNAIAEVLSNPPGEVLAFLDRLSFSYILMQLLNIDPTAINAQRDRMLNSTAILDTDVILTGLLEGSPRHPISRRIIDLCTQLGIKCFAGSHEIKEIVLRIERSIRLFNDLDRPAVIPEDKADLIDDLFLDVYYRRLKAGEIKSFDEFIRQYYDHAKQFEFVQKLIEQDLGVEVKDIQSFLLFPQNDKIARIQNSIELKRKVGQRYKSSELYKSDAIQLVVVEQQNRDALANGHPGRWFLVSGDGYSFRAYLDHRDAFKVKPCVHPVHFLEKLRAVPQAKADESTFGFILQSETMLRGTGRDYGPIIAGLTKIGINALGMGREQLLELIEDMDRADFTQWLYRIWRGEETNDQLRDEVGKALQELIEQSKSREQKVNALQAMLAKERARNTTVSSEQRRTPAQ